MRWLMVVAAVVVGLAARRAEACSCKAPPVVMAQQDLPLNAQLVVMGREVPSSLHLSTGMGGAVETRVVSLAGAVVVVPVTDLLPETDYELEVNGETLALRTGLTRDDQAPAPLTVINARRMDSPLLGSTCEIGGQSFAMSVSAPATEVGVLEVFTGPTKDQVDVTAPALVLPWKVGDTLFGFGDARLCDPRLAVSKMPDLAIRVRVVDLAGNRSEFSEPLELKAAGCSCGSGWLPLLALACLPLLRRRRGLG